jgi:hypothetical protein
MISVARVKLTFSQIFAKIDSRETFNSESGAPSLASN